MKDLLKVFATGLFYILFLIQVWLIATLLVRHNHYSQFKDRVQPIIEEMDSTYYVKRCIYLQDSLNNEVKRYIDYEK